MSLPVAVGPRPVDWVAESVVRGGGALVAPEEAEALVWMGWDDPAGLARVLRAAPGIGWVQLPTAGVELFADQLGDGRTWTSGKGVTAEPVAELAVGLLVAGRRGIVRAARLGPATPRSTAPLWGRRVVVVGGGAIGRAVVARLRATGARPEVVRRSATAVDDLPTWAPGDLRRAVAGAAGVVLALPLTPESEGMVDREVLRAMAPDAWLVNVARGGHVRTDDLVEALREGWIAGAALDVTDPEPLPADHPLHALPTCVVTPHVGYSEEMQAELLSARFEDNVRRRRAGEPLAGLVDPARGY